MTRLFNDPGEFADEAIRGLVLANPRRVRAVDGGVVRSTRLRRGAPALIIGGGSGHYPAFAGLVGAGLATGAACGNIFASPSAGQIYRVAKASQRGGGVLLSYGNYAGDVLHFGQAAERLRADGIDVRTVLVTDDIASASVDEIEKRRGIAGDLTVFKVAGAAVEAGYDLDALEAVTLRANDRTRSFGVAFDGCTHPGATSPLFTVPAGQMSVGLGIHGEPGISDEPIPSAKELAKRLVESLLADVPADRGDRAAVVVNGLGTVKYEELFVLFGEVVPLLEAAGVSIVEPEVGEFVTSLDMAGVSITLMWLDDELETLWTAPADAPAYRKGSIDGSASDDDGGDDIDESAQVGVVDPNHTAHPELVPVAIAALSRVSDMLTEREEELGRIDAIAGDGDHGIGMSRGAVEAVQRARAAADDGAGVAGVLAAAGDGWSERGGGTSGALWGVALEAVGATLGAADTVDGRAMADAVRAALAAMQKLGNAEVGDKTMVDAFVPFADSLDSSIDEGLDLEVAWTRAATVASEAAASTAELRPRLGRARPLAEKSIGHPDAGAISFGYIVAAAGDLALPSVKGNV